MNIHFIGIGGIGVSALAKYYLKKNHKISGSDLCSSEITDDMRARGARIIIGANDAKNLPKNADLVIYSPAVRKSNPEFIEAKKRKIKLQSYPQTLGELTKIHYTIAVTGTHGKSTTCAMLGLLLVKAKLNPTIIVGTKVKQLGNSNFRMGGNILVIEACEHEESFLNYKPKIEVITNIEADHLDYYKTLKNVIKGFKRFAGFLPKNGILVVNKEDKNIKHATQNIKQDIKYFSIKQPEAKKLRKILKVPGEHNVYDALAALSVARILKIPDKTSFDALSGYTGSWRRFDERQIAISGKQKKLISDYGHHPTEVRATILAAKEKYKGKRIWCIFQPHQYQRTYYLFADFVKTFKDAKLSKIIITDIYDVAGRENKKIKEKVSSEKLVEKIKKSWIEYVSKESLLPLIENSVKNFDVLIVMGAGDIYELSRRLLRTELRV